jgi:hypothetical protein
MKPLDTQSMRGGTKNARGNQSMRMSNNKELALDKFLLYQLVRDVLANELQRSSR